MKLGKLIGKSAQRLVLILALQGSLIAEPNLSSNNSTPPIPAADEPPEAAPPGLLGDWWGIRRWGTAHGIEWSLTYIGEVLGNVSGGIKPGVIFEGLGKAVLDVDLAKLAGWKGATFHVSGLYPHGDSLSEKCLGDLFILSNIDAPDDPRLFELWLQQDWWDERVSLRIGQLAADEEFASTDYASLFINGTCGWPGFIALNAPSPAYPIAAPGIRLAFKASERWRFQIAAYDGYPDTTDDDGHSTNPNGIAFNLHNSALAIGEVQRSWGQDKGASHPGFCKLGTWWHSGEFDHLAHDADGHSLTDPTSSEIAEKITGNWGGYVALQQAIWREPTTNKESWQGLGAYLRAGISPSDRNLIQRYFEGGLHYTGLIPGRNEDECGVTTVFGQLSDELRELARDQNYFHSSRASLPDYEMIVEGAYRFVIRPGWSIQPSVEYLIHPGGSSARENAIILGLRTYLEF
jgi:porin